MFFIFESVILVFPKHNNFRGFSEVIHEQIKNNQRFVKNLGRPGMKIQEVSIDFTVGEILCPSSEASYLKTTT